MENSQKKYTNWSFKKQKKQLILIYKNSTKKYTKNLKEQPENKLENSVKNKSKLEKNSAFLVRKSKKNRSIIEIKRVIES